MLNLTGSTRYSILGQLVNVPKSFNPILELSNYTQANGIMKIKFKQASRKIHTFPLRIPPGSSILPTEIAIDLSSLTFEAGIPIEVHWKVSNIGVVGVIHPSDKNIDYEHGEVLKIFGTSVPFKDTKTDIKGWD